MFGFDVDVYVSLLISVARGMMVFEVWVMFGFDVDVFVSLLISVACGKGHDSLRGMGHVLM